MNWYLGTMGFSYPDWVDVFYPSDWDARDYLRYYSRVFNAVEIDSTFYGTPRPEVVQHWDEITPPDFKICAKLPRTITHDKELVGVEGLLDEYLKSMRLLGDKLGVILIQFGPRFTAAQRPKLAEFLKLLPPDLRFAVEVRHRSWYTQKTEELLAQANVAWAATEYRSLPKRIYRTADFLYLRWIGWWARFVRYDRERLDVEPQLRWWWENIQEHLENVDSVYGFFSNDYAGFAAGTCNRFKGMFGFKTQPLTQPPKQGRLF